MNTPPLLPNQAKYRRRNSVTLKLLFIAGLLAAVHSVLYVVLRMEDDALLAGTGVLFIALAAVMYFTRRVDWCAEDAESAAIAGAAR